MIWWCFDAYLEGFDILTRIKEEENMLADFFGVNGVEEAWVLRFCPKNYAYIVSGLGLMIRWKARINYWSMWACEWVFKYVNEQELILEYNLGIFAFQFKN